MTVNEGYRAVQAVMLVDKRPSIKGAAHRAAQLHKWHPEIEERVYRAVVVMSYYLADKRRSFKTCANLAAKQEKWSAGEEAQTVADLEQNEIKRTGRSRENGRNHAIPARHVPKPRIRRARGFQN